MTSRVSLLAGRGYKQGEFEDADLARLQLALPAHVGAVEHGTRIALDRDAFEAVLEAASMRPCFALDDECRVIWASVAAKRLVGPILSGGGLPVELIAAVSRLWGAAGSGSPGQPARVAPIVAIRIACGAMSLRSEACVVGPHRRIVVVTVDAAEPARAAVTALSGRHGLTLTETDVLGWLVHGLSNREIAARSYVSVETVRTHVKRIFRKLGVSSRTEAALLVRR